MSLIALSHLFPQTQNDWNTLDKPDYLTIFSLPYRLTEKSFPVLSTEAHRYMKQTESHYVQYYNPRIGNSPDIKGCIQTAKEKKQSHNGSPCLMHRKTGCHHQMVDMTLVCLKNGLAPV